MTGTTKTLEGQVCLITAGAASISVAAAKVLVRDGAVVVLMGRRPEAMEKARQAVLDAVGYGEVAIAMGDGCNEQDIEAAARYAHGLHGRLDIAVATVGGSSFRPLLSLTDEEMTSDLRLNITSAFLLTKHVAPLMTAGGSIVCISSLAAKLTYLNLAGYNAGKAGLEQFVRVAADELGSRGIRVNAVRPGMTESQSTGFMFDIPAVVERVLERVPLGRLGTPDDIATAIRFVAGPESSWMTGQSFAVDGGNELRGNPDLTDLMAKLSA